MKPQISDTIQKYFSIEYINKYNIEISDQAAEEVKGLLKIHEIDVKYLNDILSLYAALKLTNKFQSNYFRERFEDLAHDEINILEFFQGLNKNEIQVESISLKGVKKNFTCDLKLKTEYWKNVLIGYLLEKIKDETHEFYNIDNIKEPVFHGLKNFNIKSGRKIKISNEKLFISYAKKMMKYLKNENILLTKSAQIDFIGDLFKLAKILDEKYESGRSIKYLLDKNSKNIG